MQGTYTFDNNYKVKNLKIYPVLVVNDIMFDAPGFNYLLNIWFTQEIASLPEENRPFIKPLTVLNLNTLIEVADLLRNSMVTFKELLEVYYSKSALKDKKTYKDLPHLRSAMGNTLQPASMLIENWVKDRFSKAFPMRGLTDYAYSLLCHD